MGRVGIRVRAGVRARVRVRVRVRLKERVKVRVKVRADRISGDGCGCGGPSYWKSERLCSRAHRSYVVSTTAYEASVYSSATSSWLG